VSERPSKSARKREHLALQSLGEKLIGLPEQTLRDMPLGEDLRDAILAAGRMKSHGALRRQRQLIGKLMAHTDAGPIREAYDALTRTDRRHKAVFRQAETWRDRLVREGMPALEAFAEASGRENGTLAALLRDLGTCAGEARRKTIRRQIFREVHADLQSGMQRDDA
jgi:ribosome-associated protein